MRIKDICEKMNKKAENVKSMIFLSMQVVLYTFLFFIFQQFQFHFLNKIVNFRFIYYLLSLSTFLSTNLTLILFMLTLDFLIAILFFPANCHITSISSILILSLHIFIMDIFLHLLNSIYSYQLTTILCSHVLRFLPPYSSFFPLSFLPSHPLSYTLLLLIIILLLLLIFFFFLLLLIFFLIIFFLLSSTPSV